MDPVGYTSCCVGILITAEYDPHINPVDTANNLPRFCSRLKWTQTGKKHQTTGFSYFGVTLFIYFDNYSCVQRFVLST